MMEGLKGNDLPGKEGNMFRQIIKLYETKQYKKGVKLCDKILEKYSNHGETLALKGLLFSCQGKQQEASVLVKLGLSKALTSSVAWHVYGLLNRCERKLDEAAKCYQQALKIQPDQVNILRDLALLNIQTRDYKQFKESRRKMLAMAPKQPQNWIAFVVANHLCGQMDQAIVTLDSFINILNVENVKKQEKSEVLLYKGMILIENQKFERAASWLEEQEKQIIDKIQLNDFLLQCYLQLNQTEKALQAVNKLLQIEPENLNYILKYLEIKQSNSEEQYLQNIQELRQIYPKTGVLQRLTLKYATGQRFAQLFDEYFIQNVRKGIPSVFEALKQLYQDTNKVEIMQQIALLHFQSLKSSNKFVKFPNYADLNQVQESGKVELPCCVPILLLYLSKHFSYLKQFEKAHEIIDQAIEHTPTLIELYTAKAKIFKFQQQYTQSLEFHEKARNLDQADRYLCNKSVKAYLRAGEVQKGEETMALFSKEENEKINVHEVQCLWYELALGKALMSKNKNLQAAYEFKMIEKHFNDMQEDQFDFHQYSLRKYMINIYIKFLRLEDTIFNNKVYQKSQILLIQIFLKFHDDPQVNFFIQSKEDPEEKNPEILKLAQTQNFLDECNRRVQNLMNLEVNDKDFYITAFQVFIRRSKHQHREIPACVKIRYEVKKNKSRRGSKTRS